MEVRHVTLAGRVVRLEPLRLEHVPDLWAEVTPEIMRYMPTYGGADVDEAGFRRAVERVVGRADWLGFAVIVRETRRAVGCTAYMDIRPADLGLEIGSTWYGRTFQGTAVNPESKYLLLRHAFETLGAVRVQLKTDARNLQSQRAIARLGAQREGTLRKHMRLPDGYIRDTVMFSIIDEEWPRVKADLETRLGYIP